jgi:hypothetical protein
MIRNTVSKIALGLLIVGPAHAGYNPPILLQNLGGGSTTVVKAINSTGESVGVSQTTAGGYDAVLWSATGTAQALTDVGSEGDSSSRVINGAGQSGGWSKTSTGADTVLWSASGTTTVLNKTGLFGSTVYAINSHGDTVGYTVTSTGYDPFFWTASGHQVPLADPGGHGFAQPRGITDKNKIAGFSCKTPTSPTTCSAYEAVTWDNSGVATVLQDVPGGTGNYAALAIDAAGFAVGWAAIPTGLTAVRWNSAGVPTIFKTPKTSTSTVATAENNHGMTLGYAVTTKGRDYLIWGHDGGIAATLADPGGQGLEYANAINNNGKSVGYACTIVVSGNCTAYEAVLWQPSGKATNLSVILGSDWSNTQAVGINDAGDIVGFGAYNNGTLKGTYSFLLTENGVVE